jgi:hypothetical protein
MSEPINDGGPAFPQPNHFVENSDGRVVARWCMQDSGMSLRDWFAGQALAGLLAGRGSTGDKAPNWANGSYAIADAMLKARGGAK